MKSSSVSSIPTLATATTEGMTVRGRPRHVEQMRRQHQRADHGAASARIQDLCRMHVSSGGLPGMTRGRDVNHAVVVLGGDLHRLAAVERAGLQAVFCSWGAPPCAASMWWRHRSSTAPGTRGTRRDIRLGLSTACACAAGGLHTASLHLLLKFSRSETTRRRIANRNVIPAAPRSRYGQQRKPSRPRKV